MLLIMVFCLHSLDNTSPPYAYHHFPFPPFSLKAEFSSQMLCAVPLMGLACVYQCFVLRNSTLDLDVALSTEQR